MRKTRAEYYRHLIVAMALLLIFSVKAQDRTGIRNSNYSPTNSIFLNPASSSDSKAYMQLNLAGAGVFAYNNIAYLPWFSVWRLRRAGGQVQYPEFNDNRLKRFIYANAGATGPAFTISKRNYGAGLFVNARTVGDVRGIPFELVDLFLDPDKVNNYSSSGDINLRNIKLASMSWLEYGGNFSYIIKKQQKDLWIVGGNLKYITGINIFYAQLSRLNGYYNDTLIRLDEMSGRARYNQPAFNSGRGFGLDAGFTFKRMLKSVDAYYANSKQSNCVQLDYLFKASVSLRDAGFIRFTKGTTVANLDESGQFNPSRFINSTQEDIANSLNLTLGNGPVLAALPSNLSLQLDWNFGHHLYANATLVKNLIPQRVTGVAAQDILSIMPRYEFRQIELAMPLTFQKYLYPQLGFTARYRTFVLGFDNVIPLMFMKPRTYGLGVYFSLGVTLFRNPACRISQRIVDCPPNTITKSRKKSRWKFWKKSRN